MAEPLIYIGTYKLKDGKLPGYKEAGPEWFEWNQANHPRLLHHEVYISDDGTEVTNVQVHPDAESMEFQMELIAGKHSQWQEYIDWSTMTIQVCGRLSESLRDGLQQLAGSGVPVDIKTPLDIGGFTRLEAA